VWCERLVRLAVRVVVPNNCRYNADFDGDEMNLHMPQSLLTKAGDWLLKLPRAAACSLFRPISTCLLRFQICKNVPRPL
jgi:hypothetical protein